MFCKTHGTKWGLEMELLFRQMIKEHSSRLGINNGSGLLLEVNGSSFVFIVSIHFFGGFRVS